MYSETTVDHFTRPRNVGRIDDADGVGQVDDRTTDNLITIYLKVDAGRVVLARFRTFGCSACIAASSVVTELAQGMALPDIGRVDSAAILDALDGLPAGKEHCAELAAEALRLAAKDAAVRPPILGRANFPNRK
jgi:nitrogen fixation protein NifU and related proteins